MPTVDPTPETTTAPPDLHGLLEQTRAHGSTTPASTFIVSSRLYDALQAQYSPEDLEGAGVQVFES